MSSATAALLLWLALENLGLALIGALLAGWAGTMVPLSESIERRAGRLVGDTHAAIDPTTRHLDE